MPSDAAALPSIAIIGAGSMGGAILQGLVALGPRRPAGVTVTNRTRAKADALADLDGVTSIALEEQPDGNAEAAASARIVLIGVKPAMVPDLLREIAPHLRAGDDRREPRRRRHDRDVRVDPRRRTSRCCGRCPTRPAVVGAGRDGTRGGNARVGRRCRGRPARCSRRSAPSSRCRSRRSTRCRRSRGRARRTSSCSSRSSPRRRSARDSPSPRRALMAEQTFIGAAALLAGIRRRPRRAAPPRHEPEGHDRARDRRAAGRAPRRRVRRRRRMPRSPARGSSPPASPARTALARRST